MCKCTQNHLGYHNSRTTFAQLIYRLANPARSHKKTTMEFLSILADLVAVSSALAINKETGKITIEAREPGDLCSSGTALCCQLDVIGKPRKVSRELTADERTGVADATCVTRRRPCSWPKTQD